MATRKKIAQRAIAAANTVEVLYTCDVTSAIGRITVVNPADVDTTKISINVTLDTGTTPAAASMEINRSLPKQSEGSLTLPWTVCLSLGQRIEVKASVTGVVFAFFGLTSS